MNRFSLSLLAAASTALVSTLAQAIPFEIQGTTRSITANADGSVTLVCGSVPVLVNGLTAVTSPTRTLTLAELADPTMFLASGFSAQTAAPRAGFVGGTCVAIGDDELVPGQLQVTELAVEVEENSLIGARLATPAGYNILGREVVPITAGRLSAVRLAAGFYTANGAHPGNLESDAVGLASGSKETAFNGQGFGVDINTTPVGDLGSADGYFGTDGRFYAHILETTGGNVLRIQPRPSILRAACQNDLNRARDSIEVRGGCIAPLGTGNPTVTIAGRLANGTFQTYGTAVCTIDPAATPAGANYRQGLYRFVNTALSFTNNVCASSIRAATTQAGVTRYDFVTPDAR